MNTNTDTLYMTGFEELRISGGCIATGAAVISSVIPLDGELLIIGNSDVCTEWRHLCQDLSINVSTIDGNGTAVDLQSALEAILSSNTHITHVICSSERSENTLAIIGNEVRKYRRSLIVDNCSGNIVIDSMNTNGIDYLIGGCDGDATMLIARRSKLVQAEGNARRAQTDIYALWQKSMSRRRATLEPMAC